MLKTGQGMLIGNSSAFTFLVHAETESNPYVAARPFRVNAGAVHAYAVMPGDKTTYLEELSSGLAFFLIPWGMMLFFLPYLFREILRKRNIFLGLSITLAFLLGTGGTTPLPRMMLGETAFNILTLDRFTYWASLLALPFFEKPCRQSLRAPPPPFSGLGRWCTEADGELVLPNF